MYHQGAKGPKWLSYGDTSNGIVVGHGNTAVVVEDAALLAASLGSTMLQELVYLEHIFQIQ